MSFLDRLLGRGDERPDQGWGAAARDHAPGEPTTRSTDEIALERYRYMLRTAPPEDIERAHEEAFSQLTPEQRRQVLEQLSAVVPPGERPAADDARSLARAATRAEMRQPGTIERAFGGGRGGMMGGGAGLGMGSFFMTTLAASFLGTAIAQSFFANDVAAADSTGFAGGEAPGDANADLAGSGMGEDAGWGGRESSGSWGDGDGGSGDAGLGDTGGGDFGGGDFGGGDFGGGDGGGDFG